MNESHPSSVEKVLDWVRHHPMPDGRIIPICIWGERGVGKTSWVRSYCKQRDYGFRSYHPAHDNSGGDIVGLSYYDETREVTLRARPEWLPSDKDSVQFHRQGVLFIDELNRATLPVLQGLYEPLGEGTIEQSGWKLPSNWGFVCAVNPPKAGYDVTTLDEALMDRMVHVPLGFDIIRWAAWAGRSDVHPDLVSFTARFPTMMAEAEAKLPEEIEIKTTPRSLEYLARLYEPGMDRDLLRVLALGLIGEEATDSFLSHVDSPDKPVTAEEILVGNFKEKLQAQINLGRDDLIEASQTLLVATLARYREDAKYIHNVALYLQMIGQERASFIYSQIVMQAPHWLLPLREEIARLQN